MRSLLAVVFVIAALTCAHAQVNPANPNAQVNPQSLPSTFPQYQNYAGCVMNCDTRLGTCQSSCSLSNTAAFTFAPTTTGTPTRPDPGALTQCYMSCNSQGLVCKQSCTPPH